MQNETLDNLNTYIDIIGPFIRSLWSLEAAHANASDVFVFWLAIGATLKDLFSKDKDETGLSRTLARRVIAIFNARWAEFFTNDVYFTTFALDPRSLVLSHRTHAYCSHSLIGYPLSDLIMKPAVAAPTIRIPPQNGPAAASESTVFDRPIPHRRAYDRVKEFLKPILRAMLDRTQRTPDATDAISKCIREVGAAGVVEELKNQLRAFWREEWPFDRPIENGDPYSWWRELQPHPHAHVLAVREPISHHVLHLLTHFNRHSP